MLKAEEFARILREATKAVSIENETIEGEPNLTGIDIPAGVSLRNCTFEGTVNLSMAQVMGSLDLSGSTFKGGLSLEATRIGHHLVLDGCTFQPSQNHWSLNTQSLEVKGNLKINNARLFAPWSGQEMELQGSLVAEGLTMEGDPPPPVMLNGLRAGGSVELSRAGLGQTSLSSASIGLRLYLSSTKFAGKARFIGAHIGGQANFTGVSFKGGVAFDGTEVKGDLFFQPDGKGNPCVVEGEARFHGAHIGGQASFEGASLKGGVAFDRANVSSSLFFSPDDKGNPCVVEGEARFIGVHIGGQANFEGVSFKEAAFDWAEIKGSLSLLPDDKGNPCKIEGNASFLGAHIGGLANFKGVSFKEAAFYGADIKGSLFFQPNKANPCKIEGKVSFFGAHIGGLATFEGGSFKEVTFSGAEIKGNLFFQPDDKGNPCKIEGNANFLGAYIGGQATFMGVRFKEATFSGAEIKGGLCFWPDDNGNSCKIEGNANFSGAHIGGRATFKGAEFEGDVFLGGTCIEAETILWNSVFKNLYAQGAHFGKMLNFENTEIKNDLSLKNARVYDLKLGGLKGVGGRLDLVGCEYSSLDDKECLPKLLKEKGVIERQPYEFLENYCRQIGEGSFARRVYYEWCRDVEYKKWRREAGWLWWPFFCIWNYLLRYSVGYGVKPYILLFWLLGGVFFFGLVLFKFPTFGLVEGDLPGFWTAQWISFTSLMPSEMIVEHKSGEVWGLTHRGEMVASILKVLVWFVVTVGIMAFGGLFKRHE